MLLLKQNIGKMEKNIKNMQKNIFNFQNAITTKQTSLSVFVYQIMNLIIFFME